MAKAPTNPLTKVALAHVASSRTTMDDTEELIERSRKAVMESRALLERTHHVRFANFTAPERHPEKLQDAWRKSRHG